MPRNEKSKNERGRKKVNAEKKKKGRYSWNARSGWKSKRPGTNNSKIMHPPKQI